MARKAKADAKQQQADPATTVASKSARPAKIHDLVDLCGQAADHLAEANRLLVDRPGEADHAIAALDAAIACLKEVTLESAAYPKAIARAGSA